jgi:hypothetical protein
MSRPARSFNAVIAELRFQIEQSKLAAAEHPDPESRSHDWYQGRVHQCFHTLKQFSAVTEKECPCAYCVTAAASAAAEKTPAGKAPATSYTGGLETFRAYRGTKDVRNT